MKKKIKIIGNDNALNLESVTNYFLKETDGKLHDVKFISYEDAMYVLLVYSPEDE